MAIPREDRIYLAYKSQKTRLDKKDNMLSGFNAMVIVSKFFHISILDTIQLVNNHRKADKAAQLKKKK